MNDLMTRISVPADHPSLAGHFPGNPVVPGVLLLDLIVGAIRDIAPSLALNSVVSTKFLRAVLPETALDVQVRFAIEAESRVRARFQATHAGASVVEGSFLLQPAEPHA